MTGAEEPGGTNRREFLGHGLKATAGLAAVGLGGGMLEACGSSPTASSTAPKSTASPFGGHVNIGTWSEVNSLSPPQARWDATGYLYANAIFDSLAQIGADGKPYPYLAKSITPNADHTSYTIGLRPGVLFHNGEVCDAKAVQGSLEAVATGTITKLSLTPITSITVSDPLTVVVNLDQPWPAFPSYLAGQLGYIAAPAMLKEPGQGTLNAIGTGPFYQVDWVINTHLQVARNPHYWQVAPGSGGRHYPYLDSITFIPIPDNQSREDALRSGTIQMLHTQYPGTVKDMQGVSGFNLVSSTVSPGGEVDVDFIMLNVAAPPLDDPTLRRALAMSIDKQQLQRAYGFGLTELASGPFQPGTPWYAPTTYPSYDPAGARALVNSYKAAHGGVAPAVKLATITGAAYVQITELVQQMWLAVGVNCSIYQFDFTAFLTDAVLGLYEAVTFEQFGSSDPDKNYVWWSTTTVKPPGQISLNLSRNSDSRVEDQLLIGRHSTVLSERRSAYQKVGEYLAEDLPFLWLSKTLWAAFTASNVSGVATQTLPDGQPGLGF